MTKRIASFALKVVLTVGLWWLVVGSVDWEAAIISRAKSVDILMLGIAIVLALVHIGIMSERWRVVLRAIGLTLDFKHAFQIQYIAQFFSLATPGEFGGDLLRVWKSRNLGLETISAINSIVIERTISVFVLAITVLGTISLTPDIISNYGPIIEVSLFVAAGIIIAFAMFAVLDRYIKGPQFLLPLKTVANDVNALIRQPKLGWAAMGWTFLQHFNVTVMIFVLAVGLDINVSLLECITLIPLVLFATAIPASMPSWGGRETALVVAFGAVGVPVESALILALILGLLNIIVALPGGIVWLATRDVERTEVSEDTNRWLMGLHLFFGGILLTALHKTHAFPDIGAIPALAVIGIGYYLSGMFIGAIWQRIDAKGARIAIGLFAIPVYSIVAWGLAWVIGSIK